MGAERQDGHSGVDGEDDLARLLSRQFESLGDVAPAAARVEEKGGTLKFSFIWPLTSWEEQLARSERRERLEGFRLHFLEAVAPSLAEVVEMVTGQQARARAQALRAAGLGASVVFTLGPSTGDGAEERQAIRNWSLQVRRNSRRQRAEHRRRAAEVERTVRVVREMRRRVRGKANLGHD
jgi:hypothetical protein